MSPRFTDQKPQIVTRTNLTAPWSGYTDGSHFYCKLCGHLFQEGDVYRWVFAGSRALTNLFVCSNCDSEDVLDKWEALNDEWRMLASGKFRFVANQLRELRDELRYSQSEQRR